MPKPKIAKSKRPEAERASEHYLLERCDCVMTRRALRTKFAKVDFFAADVIGKRTDGTLIYAQATAGGDGALRTRRRKLDCQPWHHTDTVIVLQLTETPDPNNRARKLWWFRLHELKPDGLHPIRSEWVLHDAVQIPKEWFKAAKDTERHLSKKNTDSLDSPKPAKQGS